VKKACVVEVGPRDGFQNVNEFIPTETKLAVIDGLLEAGIRKIQLTSFVSPKAVPQMRDAAQVVEKTLETLDKFKDAELFALVPNLHGAKAAAESGLSNISPVLSLSESHNMANVHKTVSQSIDGIAAIRQELPDIRITVDIATVFYCPFEGRMEQGALIDLIGRLNSLGICSFTLCDTIGATYPSHVAEVFRAALSAFPEAVFGAHIHDTRNMGIICSYIALQNGADSVQTTLGGLGGCPFAPGASGNTATEDFVYMLEKEGYSTGIDFDKLLDTAKFLKSSVTDGVYSGHHINIS
jgi:hydroxymethylglutaryl-CoA lyase